MNIIDILKDQIPEISEVIHFGSVRTEQSISVTSTMYYTEDSETLRSIPNRNKSVELLDITQNGDIITYSGKYINNERRYDMNNQKDLLELIHNIKLEIKANLNSWRAAINLAKFMAGN